MIDSTWYTRITEVPVRQAAGGIVIRQEGDQLWVALTVEHEADVDVITLPKGGVETGESVLQAAVREIREETGLQHIHLLQGAPADRRALRIRQRHLDLLYVVPLRHRGNAEPSDGKQTHPALGATGDLT